MKSAQFRVQVIDLNEPEEYGMNRVEFELKANKGHDFMPLQNVASGGELSRVMLALKSVNSGKKAAPTLLLDEIDSGVSGKVATAMAELLSKMGSTHQLICITHLPQIAARGQWHFKVYKTEEGETTQTHLESLNRDGRLTEIAGMLSGFDTTDAAIENARNLMHLN
jgi:DNA repair protein RecN (Recombination protein N)